MCLIVTEKSRSANEDIIAYKVLEFSRGILHTPFQYMPIEFNVTYTDKKSETWDDLYLYSGVYHLFSSIEDAKLFKAHAEETYVNKNNLSIFIIVKAIIPKGTKYYVGKCKLGWKFDDIFQHESYGTKSVIYKELDA